LANLPALVELLTPNFRQRTTAEWLALFDEIGLPAGPVLSVGEMHADPQTVAREMIVEAQHSRLGAVKTLGPPVKFSETPASVRRGAPVLGECTREVLLEAGYSAEEIDALASRGEILVA
jgi:crotonobetainyl-CoA:carnitine CoA-transferase CaiB-like acyl-CoA transferase